MMPLDVQLQINAYSGGGAPPEHESLDADAALRWALGKPMQKETFARPPADADPTHWWDPRVGYGVLLPETDGLTDEQLKTGSDAPEPIVELLRKRPGTAVLRYRPQFDAARRTMLLRNYATQSETSLDRPPVGVGPNQMPSYLLIVAPPGDGPGSIPWDAQYLLNAERRVGRLDLDEQGLGNYISHLLEGWSDAGSDVKRSVIGAVDHGGTDITKLMRRAIAKCVAEKFEGDEDLKDGVTYIDGSRQRLRGSDLIQALSSQRPAFVLTTSHGNTEHDDGPEQLAAGLGLPIDQSFEALDLEALVDAWKGDGAIWVCHACCSAGSDTPSIFAPLFPSGSDFRNTLDAIAELGAMTSPLPKRLLGSSKPLRAFVGQVEPTFSWTLRNPYCKAHLTDPLLRALYNRLYQPEGIGLAMRPWYSGLATLYTAWDQAMRRFDAGEDDAGGDTAGQDTAAQDTEKLLLYLRLASRDIQSTVILGDPTAILPSL